MNLDSTIGKAVDMAWEGIAVTLCHEGVCREYRRVFAHESFGEDGQPLAKPGTPAGDRYCIVERVYKEVTLEVKHYWVVPPHVSLN